jgi:hypothetical protein|tara:strand:+ start:76 stop:318 length:243 start_codon:yes stop_codon:yes gene_type:complete
MSTYKDIIKPSLNERSYWDEHFWEMSKGMNNIQKKVLSNLIDEYEMGRVLYMFQTNPKALKVAINSGVKLMKSKKAKVGK